MRLETPDIYCTLGIGLAALELLDEAAENLRRALDLQPDHVEAHTELARILYLQGEVDEAIDHFHRALDLKPDCAAALFYLGQIRHGNGCLDEARECYRRAAAADPAHAGAYYAAVDTLLCSGMEAELQEINWIMWSWSYVRRKFSQPRWQGATLGGKTLLVYAEQGFGDTIQLIRYLPLAKSLAQGSIVLECQEELVGLLGGCSGVDRAIPRRSGFRPPDLAFDAQIGLYDLPLLFAARSVAVPKQIPYLHADAAATRKWNTRMAVRSGLRVGLRWAGSPKTGHDATRSCHLDDFAPLAKVPNVTFFSLQKGAREEEAASPPQGMAITDLSSEIRDFTDTAAVLANLDLVISTDTCIPHLAGAMGLPVWLLLETWPSDRWHLKREDCAWYPTMRLFRQHRPGDWSEVLTRVAEALNASSPMIRQGKAGIVHRPGDGASDVVRCPTQ